MADIAVIGLSCIFPGAPDVGRYWHNIVSKVNSIGDPPPDWGADIYFDPEARSNDRIYCKRGGYLGELATFDPFEYGVMPNSLDGGEPDHYLALRVADEALKDAGYDRDTINPEMTEVIIGRGTYINRGVTNLFQHGVVIDQTIGILRELNPDYTDADLEDIRKALKDKLPPFIPETTSSLVPNVLAGRIANRLNLMGANYLVDAACASSLVAVEHGIRDLSSGRCDLAIVGGVNAYIPPPILMIFCQINALSRRQELKAFDEAADGTLLGEGLGFVVLKRKEDAIRDGDRIYAVVKSVGVASDGRVLGLLAPRAEGQALAMQRAYDESGISPDTVGLVEAHGTGVPVGDITEIESLRRVFGPRKGKRPWCAIGTVKSMISHLIPAAGIAGFIKACLALYHKVLPPTLCEKPNPRLGLESTPFYINTETRPWIHGLETPRRAAVNAFGFGGINAHAILEEHADDTRLAHLDTEWDSEVVLLGSDTRDGLVAEAEVLKDRLETGGEVSLKDVAYTCATLSLNGPFRLSIVATSLDDLVEKLGYAVDRLRDPACVRIRDKSGIYYFEDRTDADGKVAFLFPGEGSQYPEMLSDLCMSFPEVREVFDLVDSAFIKRGREYLPSHMVFPLPLGQDGFDDMRWKMDVAAEAVFTSSQALLKVMDLLEVSPDAMLGHSTGEYSALIAGGMIRLDGREGFIDFVLGVNKVYEELASSGKIAEGVLLAVGGVGMEKIESLVENSGGSLFVAMENCPNQVVLCGQESAIAGAERSLKGTGAVAIRLPFARAYHTPMFKEVSEALRRHFDSIEVACPAVDVYSCVTAERYPDEPDAIRDLATVQWSSKVRFRETIEAMYRDGVRVFIEVGPRGNLTAFVDDILRKKPHLAVPSNLHRRSGLRQINELVAVLYASRVHVNPLPLYARRSPVDVLWDCEERAAKKKKSSIKINTLLPRIELGEDARRFVRSRRAGVRVEAQETEDVSADTPRDMRDMVMAEYLRNMEEFLRGQEEILSAFVSGGTVTAPVVETTAKRPVLIDRVVSAGDSEIIALCELDISRDRFLLDHTLGGKVSVTQSLNALPVVPLTFSMEMLAEGASLLFPSKLLIGMKEVRAYRWIGLDEGRRTLQIHAKVSGASEAHVRIIDADPHDPAKVKPGMPLIEGTMVFGERYPVPPAPMELKLKGERSSRWAGKDLYEGFMFHGPTLQAVDRMELWGENGATARLKAMPMEPLFTDRQQGGGFLSDPVVLDAAGQVIAYWTSDHLETGFHIFPFRLEELTLYGPCLIPPERAECRAAISLEGDSQVRSDIDIIDGAGFLRIRLKGWWDRRFDMPDAFYRLRASIPGNTVSTPVKGLFGAANVYCCILDCLKPEFLESHDRIWERVLARLVLSMEELAEFSNMAGTAKRRMEWLIGRAASKDAVRMLSAAVYGCDLYPADIRISKDPSGRPVVERAEGLVELPLVSIAHSSGVAAAACCTDARGLGIDIERIRELEEGFDSAAFTDHEREMLRALAPSLRNEWMLRMWGAKEVVAKALGTGLMGRQRELVITSFDTRTGEVEVSLTGGFKSAVGDGCDKVNAYTMRRGEFVLAGAVIK